MTYELLQQNAPALVLAVPLLFAFLTPIVDKISDKLRDGTFFVGLLLMSFFVAVMAHGVYTEGSWEYVFGAAEVVEPEGSAFFRIHFLADGVSAMASITLAISAIGAGIYAYSFMKDETGMNKFYTLFLLTIAGVNGMVLTGDLFNLFVWFEVASVATCALVAFKVYEGQPVEAALKYMIISVVAGLFLLFSVGLLYGQYGVLNFELLSQSITGTQIDKLALAILVVVMGLKSGAVPLHFVTPDAYSMAPGSVTAVLVVASQAGLWVLFRTVFSIYGVAINTLTVGWIIIILGVLSMFIGVTMALVQKTVKRLMAYHAVSQTGYMLLGVGVGLAVLAEPNKLDAFGTTAMEGGIFHIINHAMYKGLLFLTAGVIIYKTGKRKLDELGGLGHKMKWTMIFFMIGALSIAGIPPFNGFASKLMIYRSVYAFSPILTVIAMVVSILTLASFVKVFHSIFMGPEKEEFLTMGEAPKPMLVGMGILAFVVILFSLFPGAVVSTVVEPAIEALGVGGI